MTSFCYYFFIFENVLWFLVLIPEITMRTMQYITNKTFFLITLFFCTIKVGVSQVNPPVSQRTIRFAENKNQWDSVILFRAQLDGGALFLESNCFTYSLYDKETFRDVHHPHAPQENNSGYIS